MIIEAVVLDSFRLADCNVYCHYTIGNVAETDQLSDLNSNVG